MAFTQFEAGDLAGARRQLEPLAAAHAADARFSAMAGQIALADGRAREAVRYFRHALAAAPTHVELRTKLAFALLESGELEEARIVAEHSPALALRRVAAFVAQRQGRLDAAAAAYQDVLKALPGDYESWTNLGLVLTERGAWAPAIEALSRATTLAPSLRDAWLQLSRCLAAANLRERRREELGRALSVRPGDPVLLLELGLAEVALGALDDAEATFRSALAHRDPPPALFLELGMLLERRSRLDDMARLVEDARAIGRRDPELDLVEAWLLRRRGHLSEALALAERTDQRAGPIRRGLVIAQASDGLGDARRAFAAFAEVNSWCAREPASRTALESDFLTDVRIAIDAAGADIGSADRTPGDRSTPVFLLGFPRSGTTLLDTLLMNLPEYEVLEEVPLLERIWSEISNPRSVLAIPLQEQRRLRERYFALARALLPDIGTGRILLDKFPLNMVRIPLLHRLFPDAKIVFAQRHPCDVVLSCFMARFENNRAMVHFHTIEGAARLYDLAMQAWMAAFVRLPLAVHVVRYEELVARPEREMRELLAFLGHAWRPEVMDNQGSAARRADIATASYAQVGQPITKGAVDRWRRYREELAPVLPILAPWVERLGYTF